MRQNEYIHYHRNYGWDLNDYKTMLKFANKSREQLTLFSYGCNLDNNSIHLLIEEYFLSEVVKRNESFIEVEFDSYDSNLSNQIKRKYTFRKFYIEEKRLIEFENEVSQHSGKHIRCDINVRGHFEVKLNNKLYSTLVYKKLDCSAVYREAIKGQYLFLIDTESTDNEEMRNKMHLLPKNIQSLNLPINFTEIQKEVYVKDWIRQILEEMRLK